MKSWKYWVYAGVIIVATGGFAMYWNAEPKWQENTVENLEHERYGVRRGAVRQLAYQLGGFSGADDCPPTTHELALFATVW